MSPGIRFNAGAFTKSFIGRRAKRWLKGAFDSIGGPDNMLYLIENDKSLIEYIPPAQRYELKRLFRERFSDYLQYLSDEDVYSWLPDDYLGVVEATPKGSEWVYKQIKNIRDFLATP
jgi:hypothetical protein